MAISKLSAELLPVNGMRTSIMEHLHAVEIFFRDRSHDIVVIDGYRINEILFSFVSEESTALCNTSIA